MAQIVLTNGERVTTGAQLQNLPPVIIRRMVPVDVLAARLAAMRAEWAEATGGAMESVTVNLALLFDDLARLIAGE